MRLTRLAGACLATSLLLSTTSSAQRNTRIDARELETWLSYLASDDLQGRQVYSEGLGLAAAYIAEHLKSWGVKPAGDRGSYFQIVTVQGVQTTSRSSVTVTVNGQSRTFKDGEGVTFAREQGGPQTLAGAVEFVGYGLTFPPLDVDDYAGHDVKGKVAVYFGRGGTRVTPAHNRLVNGRARAAIEQRGAMAAIGPEPPTPQPPAQPPSAAPAGAPRPRRIQGAPPSQPAPPDTPRVDFTSAHRLDRKVAPAITAGDAFFDFLLTGSGYTYADIKQKAEKREPLPEVVLRDARITINVDASYEVVQTRLTRNVAGVVAGRDTAARGTYVLFGAHYDHVGYQQFAGTDATGVNAIADCTGQTRPTPRPGDVINNGADDDGSGTVALMALAKAFATGARPRRSVMFVWHAGEEGGLTGSRYMADHPLIPLDKVAAQVNIDMIGRNRCDRSSEANTVYVVGSDRISTELHNLNEEANAALPRPLTLDYEFNDDADIESYYTRSDHYSYASKGVPVIFFFNGVHRDYHYVTDEVDKILFPKMARITELAYATAWRLADLDHLPVRDNRGPRAGKGHGGKLPQTRVSGQAPGRPSTVAASDWIQLFNGRDLADWTIKFAKHEIGENLYDTFRVEDGLLKVRYDKWPSFNGEFGHIFYKDPFSYYLLAAEYRFVGDQVSGAPAWAMRNNGLMLHSPSPHTMLRDQDFPVSLEVQLLGGLGTGPRTTANLCTPGSHVVYRAALHTTHCTNSTSQTYDGDQWVRVEVLVHGDELVRHFVDGQTVLEYTKPQIGGGGANSVDPVVKVDGTPMTGGYISLQAETAPTDFRKVELVNLEGCTDSRSKSYRPYIVKSNPTMCR